MRVELAPAVRFELTTKRLTVPRFPSQKAEFDRHRDTHRCPGKGCLTVIPIERKLCQFCLRTVELARKLTKRCLRCKYELTLDWFSLKGKNRLCDSCRYDGNMTPAETKEAQRQAHDEYRQRNLIEIRRKDREYRQKKAA